MNVVIMCQGQQRRLPDLAHPKHLLEVGGEPILQRTLRMLLAMSRAATRPQDAIWVTVVGDAVALLPAVKGSGASASLVWLHAPGTCIVDGILDARGHAEPGDRNVILLGDVVWSWAALEQVLADRRPLVFAGTPELTAATGEVFALAFDDPQAVENLCRTCPCRVDGTRRRSILQMQGGHLRRLLWWAQAQQQLRTEPGARRSWHPSLYLPIEDWTTDVDTPADVAALPELARQIELEERGR